MLRDWQLALARIVESRSSGRTLAPEMMDGLSLDDAERTWLREVSATRGLALTSLVPKWWRETRVRRAASLTLAALGDAAEPTLAGYRRAVPNFTLFYVSEGLAFLEYVEREVASPRVRAVAQFERAMWNVRQDAAEEDARGDAEGAGTSSDAESLLRPHPAATVASFEAPLARTLTALLKGEPLPDPDGELHHALVAPGLPRRWRAATSDETRVFRACAAGATARALAALPGSSVELVAELCAVRALI